MKLPAIYIKTWKLSQCEPDMPKLGLNWWRVASKPKDRGGIDIIHPWGRIDLTYTTNRVKYEKDIGEYKGVRIL